MSSRWSDWVLKLLAANRAFVAEVSLANATRTLVVSVGDVALAIILVSGIIWKVVAVSEVPALVRVLSWLIGVLALAQGLRAAWMGLQIAMDLRARPVPLSGEYLRSLRRPSNETFDEFLDGTGLSPKYAVPVFIRQDGHRDLQLFFAPLSYLKILIALDAATKSGGVQRVRGAYFPHTYAIQDLRAAELKPSDQPSSRDRPN